MGLFTRSWRLFKYIMTPIIESFTEITYDTLSDHSRFDKFLSFSLLSLTPTTIYDSLSNDYFVAWGGKLYTFRYAVNIAHSIFFHVAINEKMKNMMFTHFSEIILKNPTLYSVEPYGTLTYRSNFDYIKSSILRHITENTWDLNKIRNKYSDKEVFDWFNITTAEKI